ncbi:MAG: tRNA 2-thiouridine(34) synthase MnmA [Actinomycetota bacterium]
MTAPQVLVAMSGGVDSSVAAALAVEAGWDVTGVHLKLADTPGHLQVQGKGCCTLADADDARRVAGTLGVPFYVWDMAEEFQRAVVDDFAAEYAGGRTPNPCARCNEQVKVVGLLARARALGFDALVTGHYARVEGGRLYRGADAAKDQSYVLYMLGPAELEHLRLPLGGLSKPEVRATAARLGLRTAAKPESYDVCFVPDGDTAGWLERRFGPRPGQVVDTAGRVLGHHRGAYRYTVGQRRGLGIAAPTPRYVLRVEPAAGRVVVGERAELAITTIELEQATATDGRPLRPGRAKVRLRAHGTEVGCRVVPLDPVPPEGPAGPGGPGGPPGPGGSREPGGPAGPRGPGGPEGPGESREPESPAGPRGGIPARRPGGRVRLELDEPVDAVAPGQAGVLYDGDLVLGGGTVSTTSRGGDLLTR